MRFVFPALIGVPLGVTALNFIDANTLRIVIAVFLLVYGGYFGLRATSPQIVMKTPAIDMEVGFVGGVLGGMASLSGVLPTMWCSMRTWSKTETRAILQPFNVIVLVFSAAMLAWNGAYSQETLLYFAIALPVTMLFAQLGIVVFKRLGDHQYRRLLIAITFVAGAMLAARTLWV